MSSMGVFNFLCTCTFSCKFEILTIQKYMTYIDIGDEEPTFPLILWSEDEPWITLVKVVSSSVSSLTYRAVTVALLAAGWPIGAPWIRSWTKQNKIKMLLYTF